MQPVVRVARSRERAAASRLGKDLRIAEEQQSQLDQLLAYRDQYMQGYQSAGKAGLTAAELREYQLFISRINDAIVQQRQQVIASRKSCERSSSSWQDSRMNSRKIDKVVEKRRVVEVRESNNRERREQDDRRTGPVKAAG